MEAESLSGGFDNAPVASAHAFRVALDVMARPGKIGEISGALPPAPMSVAAGSLILTLCDPETPVWLAPSLQGATIADWVRFHTGAPLVANRAGAMFAVGRWEELAPITDFPIGTPQYPDRSTTLIVEMGRMTAIGPTLRGPGIKDSIQLGLPDVKSFQENAALFPLGLDFYFTAGSQIAALPRTTKLEG